MAEPISAITIVSAAVKVVTTSVTTAQTISDYVSRYKIAEIQIVAMKTECSAVLTALLELQNIIIQQNHILQQPTAGGRSQRLAYVQTDYRGILTQCSNVFALLNERLEKLNVQQLNKRSQSSAKAKIRAVWFGDSMRILRENIKGQVSAITLLLVSFQAYVRAKPPYKNINMLIPACGYSGASARNTDSLAAIAGSEANTAQMLEKIFRTLTRPENAALLRRVADDAQSLSSLPLRRNIIERDEDAQTLLEGLESILGDRPSNSNVHRRSDRARNPAKSDKGKGTLIEDPPLESETLGSSEAASTLHSDRSSFVTARSRFIPSIKSIFGSRGTSVPRDGSSDSTLYGASSIRRAPQTQRQPQTQAQLEMRTLANHDDTPNAHEVSSGEATRESMDELQDEQRARWEYLMELSPHQVTLDQTIDEYEETEKGQWSSRLRPSQLN